MHVEEARKSSSYGELKAIALGLESFLQLVEGHTIYISFDGLTYNTRGYFASCVVFFLAQQGRGKIQAMSKMSASIIC